MLADSSYIIRFAKAWDFTTCFVNTSWAQHFSFTNDITIHGTKVSIRIVRIIGNTKVRCLATIAIYFSRAHHIRRTTIGRAECWTISVFGRDTEIFHWAPILMVMSTKTLHFIFVTIYRACCRTIHVMVYPCTCIWHWASLGINSTRTVHFMIGVTICWAERGAFSFVVDWNAEVLHFKSHWIIASMTPKFILIAVGGTKASLSL